MDVATGQLQTSLTMGDLIQIVTLIGILVTAVFGTFKVGRWAEGLIGRIDGLKRSIDRVDKTLHEHITDEMGRFAAIEEKLRMTASG